MCITTAVMAVIALPAIDPANPQVALASLIGERIQWGNVMTRGCFRDPVSPLKRHRRRHRSSGMTSTGRANIHFLHRMLWEKQAERMTGNKNERCCTTLPSGRAVRAEWGARPSLVWPSSRGWTATLNTNPDPFYYGIWRFLFCAIIQQNHILFLNRCIPGFNRRINYSLISQVEWRRTNDHA